MDNFDHFGYGYIKKPTDVVPNVPLTFYAFHIMVILGGYFLLFFILTIYMEKKSLIAKHKWYMWLAIASIPLVYICSQAGWVVAEVGRQPWTIQDLLPVGAAVSGVNPGSVRTTLVMFFVLFTILLIAELGILFKVIKKGPGA
jgi:cytochrome d ubiquinol oxidase subunit I